jgi:hypothetical protein
MRGSATKRRHDAVAQSCEAIVLLGAYEGANWIVTPRSTDGPGELITVARLDQRFRYHIGSRESLGRLRPLPTF